MQWMSGSSTYHFDSGITWEEGEQVLADELGLDVEPVSLEYIALLACF